ncbi:MAG: 5'/3'-nucleotidase SurE [Brevinematales bacterium]|nr:5'/3'-nucleotidase SurE [Brevinematales bacterium]
MNILITNDDGYFAEGINYLREELIKNFNVFMCAPLTEKSASSHSITLFKRMELKKIDNRSFAVNGTPADCVKVALLYLFKDIKFDFVVSGINNGPNMGDDIFYSGTVAGAREGLLNNIFSIAASVDGWNTSKDFTLAAKFIKELIHKIKDKKFGEKILLNINFPNDSNIKGVKIAHLGRRIYKDSIIFESLDGKEYVTIGGEDPSFEFEENSDLQAVSEGFIAITPLINEVSDKKTIQNLIYLEKENFSIF